MSANGQATSERAERLVDATGPYVTRCGGMDFVTKVGGASHPYPARSKHTSWTGGGFQIGTNAQTPLDLIHKADVGSLLAACVRNLLLLHEEADPSDERLAFLADRLVKEYELLLAEWDDLAEANDRRPGKSAAEFNADEAGEATAGGDEEESAEAKPADLITGPGRYPQRDGGVATVKGAPTDHYLLRSGFAWEGKSRGKSGPTGWHSNGAYFNTARLGHDDDIVGPRIPDDLSDEAAAAHARMVAEGVRRKQAADLPDDPDPCGCEAPIEATVAAEAPKLEEEIGPFSGQAMRPKFKPEEMVAYGLEEPLVDGLWWVWWHWDQQRAKAHVYRSKASDGWLVELTQEKTVHSVSDEGVACNGSLQLVRRVIEPTTRPYTIEEVEPFVLSRFVRQRGITTGRVAIIGVAPEFRDDRMRMHVEEPVLKLSMALDGESLFTMGEFLARFEWADDGSPCGVVTAGDPWNSAD